MKGKIILFNQAIEVNLLGYSSGWSIQPQKPTIENLISAIGVKFSDYSSRGWRDGVQTLICFDKIIQISPEECWAAVYSVDPENLKDFR